MRAPVRIVIDLVLVLVFAVIGRASHGEALSLSGIATTAWPFLVGCLVGSLVAVLAMRVTWLTEGLVVWLVTVLVGMVLRSLSGGGMAAGFLVVATVVLAAFLIGWRAIASRLPRRA